MARKTLAEKSTEKNLDRFVSGSALNKDGHPAWEGKVHVIPTSRIHIPDFNFRCFYNEEIINKIKVTIEELGGIKEPLLLRPHPSIENEFELIAGSQRLKAANELEQPVVPALIDDVDDLTAASIALIENDARSDFSPYEKTRGVLQILMIALECDQSKIVALLYALFNEEVHGRKADDPLLTDEARDIIKQALRKTGIKLTSFVTNNLTILKFPKNLLEALEKGELQFSKALIISKVKNPVLQSVVIKEAVEKQFSVKELKQFITDLKKEKIEEENPDIMPLSRISMRTPTKTVQQRLKNIVKRVRIRDLEHSPTQKRVVIGVVKKLEALLSEDEFNFSDQDDIESEESSQEEE